MKHDLADKVYLSRYGRKATISYADVSARNGWNALTFAWDQGNAESVKLLLKMMDRPYMPHRVVVDEMAIQAADKKGHYDVVRILREAAR
jgi:hypothetical protein